MDECCNTDGEQIIMPVGECCYIDDAHVCQWVDVVTSMMNSYANG